MIDTWDVVGILCLVVLIVLVAFKAQNRSRR